MRRHHPAPWGRPRTPRRAIALAIATALAITAVVFLARREATPERAGSDHPAPPAPHRAAVADRAGDATPPAGPAVPQAGLSPLAETVCHPGMAADAVGRVLQRHAMSRFFADAQDIERARDERTLMAPATPTDAIAGMGILTPRQQADGRAFIRYEPRTLESRVEGDTLDIFLPGVGLTARAVIERVESVDGLLRWSGRFADFQEGGTFSVTHALGDRYAVGSFDTPVGTFSMEARNGWGWVAPPSSDFFLPDGHDDGVPAPAERASR